MKKVVSLSKREVTAKENKILEILVKKINSISIYNLAVFSSFSKKKNLVVSLS